MYFNKEQHGENKSSWKLKINSRNTKFYKELKDTFKEVSTQVEYLKREDKERKRENEEKTTECSTIKIAKLTHSQGRYT